MRSCPTPPVNEHQTRDTRRSKTGADAIITGWAVINETQPDCVLIADQAGTVTGGGVIGLPLNAGQATTASAGATAWQATAGPTSGALTVLAVQGGRLYRIS
jgi:hypothetical protein